MDFFTALLKAYENAEETGWVDSPEKGETILLPIYHTSLKSNGKNIITVKLDQSGQLIKAEFLEADKTIIFPVTSDSVARAGKNPAPHPLVDKLNYYVSEINQTQYETYHAQLENWISFCQDSQVKSYLQLIQQFIQQPEFLNFILKSLFSTEYKRDGLKIRTIVDGKEKIIDLSAYFLEFTVDNFIGVQTVSVTNFKALHEAYIDYTEAKEAQKIICNISGKEEVLATKHRGLIGNAKLISVSNNGETYKGRFKERDDVFTVGNQTSEKIHLMAKFFLENSNTHTWLGSGQHLINWFDDDLANQSLLDITRTSIDDEEEDDEDEVTRSFISQDNKNIRDSFIRGRKLFHDSASYYAAILNKTNDGRIALKYFRQLQASQLLQHLEKWQSNYSWEARKKNGQYYLKTPSLNDIVTVAYGVDRDRFLELDNDSFRSDQFQKLVSSLLDGKPVPNSIVKKIENNIKQRQKYRKHWWQVQQVSLGILHKQKGEEFTPMLDHTNTDRSYLFGRLLAIFELIEAVRYHLDGNDSDRITNADRYWTAYTGQPAKMMEHLTNKVKPYEEVVKLNSPGSWYKLDKERREIIELLSPMMNDKDFNQALDYRFIFGYYAEKKFYYTKQEKMIEEGEE
ncbi:type I-C CRISPR-associated protein Cas8c/Csd1 [Streptococcus sobrinus]|uniref:type I-C CRISPR-associated protein Cas8c/Csd1 n=1 Tax=Streptococcus sobrinus TaxID=1310 RepID=UPI000318D6CE|nr:type I-C CRISPR-associated protein Cas8c/Csd1 [Streptococcus sobrinus]